MWICKRTARKPLLPWRMALVHSPVLSSGKSNADVAKNMRKIMIFFERKHRQSQVFFEGIPHIEKNIRHVVKNTRHLF